MVYHARLSAKAWPVNVSMIIILIIFSKSYPLYVFYNTIIVWMDTYFPVEEFFQDDPALIEANKKTSSSYKIDFCITLVWHPHGFCVSQAKNFTYGRMYSHTILNKWRWCGIIPLYYSWTYKAQFDSDMKWCQFTKSEAAFLGLIRSMPKRWKWWGMLMDYDLWPVFIHGTECVNGSINRANYMWKLSRKNVQSPSGKYVQ